jgi:5-methylthioribose kinase
MAEAGELSTGNVQGFLHACGLLAEDARVEVEELGGGISNIVLRVAGPDRCLVVKQSLPKLRVRADWPFDQKRTLVEHDCLVLLERLVPGAVPKALHCDEDAHALVIACVPEGGVLWKTALLRGEIDPGVAGRAGELLGRIHRDAAGDDAVRERFADQTVLVQGRTDPYHATVAQLHPALAPAIEAEVERLLATRRTLTLGDYSPKNLFVYPERVVAIDFEVAHWGDPAFDVAFCLTHLSLKAVRFEALARRYLAAGDRFWRDYCAQEADRLCDEAGIVRELGCLLLARVDGKSPVEYIEDERRKDVVRGIAAELLIGPDRSVPAALAEVASHVARAQPERVAR